MAYQEVKVCRFYVDILQWYKSVGLGSCDNPIIGLNPAASVYIPLDQNNHHPSYFFFNKPLTHRFSYWGLLGHTNATDQPYVNVDSGTYYMSNDFTQSEIINVNGGNDADYTFDHDGFSIMQILDSNGNVNPTELDVDIDTPLRIRMGNPIGSFTMGNIYDMPHSSDLSTLSYEYDGIKTTQSKGGSTLSNTSYNKPPDWGNAGAWQLDGNYNVRSGRRVWSLSFSYLQPKDIFPTNPSTGYMANATTGYSSTDYYYGSDPEGDFFNTNIESGTDFFSSVWNRTINLPFIFQPDKDNNNEFAICRFDMNSLKVTQTSPSLYQISLKIRESW